MNSAKSYFEIMNQFHIHNTAISGLKVVERQYLNDSRGFFSRLFCSNELSAAGWNRPIVQINHSFTHKKGAIRGLHFQYPPFAEMKLVTCLKGAVWDLAVDLRSNSSTFLQWHAEELSSVNCRSLLIPEGFAHGFQTLTDDCELIYQHSNEYSPTAEAGLNFGDPMLAIDWPLEIAEIAVRDKQHHMLDRYFSGLTL